MVLKSMYQSIKADLLYDVHIQVNKSCFELREYVKNKKEYLEEFRNRGK